MSFLSVPRCNLAHVATLTSSLVRIVTVEGEQKLFRSEHVGTTFDQMTGGFLVLAAAVAEELHSKVDWVEYAGVFSYECLEWDENIEKCKSLPVFLLKHILPADMFKLAECAHVPDYLPDLVSQWMDECTIPQKQQ